MLVIVLGIVVVAVGCVITLALSAAFRATGLYDERKVRQPWKRRYRRYRDRDRDVLDHAVALWAAERFVNGREHDH